jgi:hypothetical protein
LIVPVLPESCPCPCPCPCPIWFRIVRVPVPLPDLVLPESCACPCPCPISPPAPPVPGGHPTFRLNARRLALAKPDAIVMHPGPMNRGVGMAVLWLLAQEGPRRELGSVFKPARSSQKSGKGTGTGTRTPRGRRHG